MKLIKKILHLLYWLLFKPIEIEDCEIDEREAVTIVERISELDTASQAIRVMQHDISLRVAAGFDSRDSIISLAMNEALIETEIDADQWLQEQATRLTDASLSFHMRMQKHWLHETDCDRLDEAFAELDRNGIVARQNFACCINCGHDAIWQDVGEAEIKSVVRDGNQIMGYVFFHRQDTEDAIRNGFLMLAYGAARSQEESEIRKIAQLIIQTLERHGFTVSWEGSINKRIRISNLQWQRRRAELWEDSISIS